MLQLEQKLIELLRYIFEKFGNPDTTVTGYRIWAQAITKSNFLNPAHREFVECDLDNRSSSKMKPSLWEGMAKQALIPGANIEKPAIVKEAARPYLQSSDLELSPKEQMNGVLQEKCSQYKLFRHKFHLFCNSIILSWR